LIAEIICIGNELLTGLIDNSNSSYLSKRLQAAGIQVGEVTVVADNQESIARILGSALTKSDLILITGGLGPTDDDLTREAVAAVLKRSLILDQKYLKKLEELFKSRGFMMTENNRKQAQVIEGSIVLQNEIGTAPGAIIAEQDRIIVLLPGPPPEMQLMFDNHVLPFLQKRLIDNVYLVKTLKCIGYGESLLEEKIKALGRWKFRPLSYIARGLEVDLQIKGIGSYDKARTEIAEAEKLLRNLLGNHIFGDDEQSLVGAVTDLLKTKTISLAVAESCSGGLLADLITDQAGSSEYFKGGIVAYSGEAKINILGLSKAILDNEGPVSAATAKAMSEAVCKIFNADFGIGITGLAGPTGDNSGKPIGTVFIAVTSQLYAQNKVKEFYFSGIRRTVKERAAQQALNILRLMLIE
jgi:nicotinamide-nucleotide amidase